MTDVIPKSVPQAKPIAVVVALLVAQLAVLKLMGRPVWCDCCSPFPWVGDVNSTHESKHVVDPYTFSHFVYGLMLFALLRYAVPSLGLGWRTAIATSMSSVWEVVENTPFVINRFRQGTISEGYSGDGLVNSSFDTFAAIAGFLVAARIDWRASLAVGVAIELGCLIAIRDGLSINTIMLIRPIEAIRQWQAGAPAP